MTSQPALKNLQFQDHLLRSRLCCVRDCLWIWQSAARRALGSQGKVTLGLKEVLLLGRRWEGPWVRKEQVSALLSLLILKYDH